MRKLLLILATAVLVLFMGFQVGQWWLNTHNNPELPQPAETTQVPPDNPAALGMKQCPAMELISAPGTWESRVDDDPLNPQTWPSYMRTITDPLKEKLSETQLRVWTLPYVAQLRNLNGLKEATYDESRAQGTERVIAELVEVHTACPNTRFILGGFSQGAAIQGDVAHKIGTGQGVVPASSVASVILVADSRRENNVGINPGLPVTGAGVEISLKPFNALIKPLTPGATMRGSRPGGFGELNDRTYQICAPGDGICDAPTSLKDLPSNAENYLMGNLIHTQYATNPNVIKETTASQWAVNHITAVVEGKN